MNSVPIIGGPTVMNMIVGVSQTITMNVTDPDGDPVTMELSVPVLGGMFDSNTLEFVFTPANMNPVSVG